MELLYLLGTILSTFFTSFFLSLLLPFLILFRRRFFSRASVPSFSVAGDSVSFYEGTVWHERRRPVHHSFHYNVRYAFFDLDNPATPKDHHSPDYARQMAGTAGPVFLLTIPPSVGYEQNPLSLYFCYDIEGSTLHLKKCIAEVTNTPWGERVSFVFSPNSDVVAKPLHVSPFMDMHGNWSIKTNSPGEKLFVSISVRHPHLGDYFVATLRAKRVSSSLVPDHEMFFWLMPHKVALWIYWHALKLWWKNVKFVQHPRYTNPAYKEEALIRDQKLHCCPAFLPNRKNHLQVERNDRWVSWRDAKWPWA